MSDETTTEPVQTASLTSTETVETPAAAGGDDIISALRFMYKEMQGMKSNIDSLQGSAQAVNTPMESAAVASTEGVDIEMLDNKGLVGYVENRLTEAMRPVVDTIQQLNNSKTKTVVEDEVTKLRSDNTQHFDSFVSEVRDIMEKKGSAIGVEEALILAKANDPGKVERLEKERVEALPTPAEKPFIGLLPTSGKSTRSDRMEAKEAASAAWEELGLDEVVKEISN